MVLDLRVLYGLHERFVLFPYERGGRRTRLVVRASHLHRLCHIRPCDKPMPVGAPLVLGEVMRAPMSTGTYVPVLFTGDMLQRAVQRYELTWALRNHRVAWGFDDHLRFESGTKLIFATFTSYYAPELLLGLVQGNRHEPDPRTGVPRR